MTVLFKLLLLRNEITKCQFDKNLQKTIYNKQ